MGQNKKSGEKKDSSNDSSLASLAILKNKGCVLETGYLTLTKKKKRSAVHSVWRPRRDTWSETNETKQKTIWSTNTA